MEYRYACIIDADNVYVDFVLVIGDEVQYYTLRPGETVIDAPCPVADFCRPRWTGNAWEETATPEELAAWEAEMHPPMPDPPPDPVETIADLQRQLADLQAQMAALTGGEG